METSLAYCRPELVEGGSVRLSQLAYVVAFAGSGAKDVTSRLVRVQGLGFRASLLDSSAQVDTHSLCTQDPAFGVLNMHSTAS